MADNTEFNIFDLLTAIDNKDYKYYDKLSEENKHKSKVSYYMLLKWITSVSNNSQVLSYYISSVDYYANKHGLDETISKHPELQWLMLCAASPKIGRVHRKWISQIPENISFLKEEATLKKITKYFSSEYGIKENDSALVELSKDYVKEQNKKYFLAKEYNMLKLEDIEVLNNILTNEEIEQYKKDSGY